jgi:hypothetical protein
VGQALQNGLDATVEDVATNVSTKVAVPLLAVWMEGLRALDS